MVRLADYVIFFLEGIGVKDIFTVSGGGAIFLNDALAKNGKINYYCCHHEQAVAMATEAYARVKKRIGVSLVTTGPGGTNTITGIAGSWIDSVPHLIISGQVFLNQTIQETGVRQLGIQELNIIDIVKPITKYAIMLKNKNEIKYHLKKAIYLATTGRPGPVWIDIPANLQMDDINESDLSEFDLNKEEVHSLSDYILNYQYDAMEVLKEKVAMIVELLRNSKRPLIHVGQGVKISKSEEEFMYFVEKNKLPFVTARNANDIVSTNHPMYIGRPGTFAQRGANFAVQNSDLYIAIGTRLSIPQTGYNSKDYARNAIKIMVDIDRNELNKPTLEIDLKINCDAKEFLLELNRQLESFVTDASINDVYDANNTNKQEWLKLCQNWKEKYPVVLPEYKEIKDCVNSYYFIDVLSDVLKSDDTIVTDMGIAFQGTHQAFKVKKGQNFFTNSGFASMGWGLPAAIGACIASGKKRTICISGEGGLQMNIQELATVMQNKLPIKLFIYNNGGYLTIKQTQELNFGRLMGCNQETGLSFPIYQKIAEAHNIKFVRIGNHLNLKSKIVEILELDDPVICELIMDPNQSQIPKFVPRKDEHGKTIPTPIEDLYPYLDRKEFKENMIVERDIDKRDIGLTKENSKNEYQNILE